VCQLDKNWMIPRFCTTWKRGKYLEILRIELWYSSPWPRGSQIPDRDRIDKTQISVSRTC